MLPVAPPPLSDPSIVYEFSDATWVKVIATTSHTNHPIELRELITPDTNNPSAKDWRNGEPDEVETEWQLLQTDFMSSDYNPTNGVGGKNGQLPGKTNNVSGDDVVTYRYEYYAYVGPYADLDTHEAYAQSVAPDGIHGVGLVTNSIGDVLYDLSTNVVVGQFLGAQMSAIAVKSPVGLINHLPDAELNALYSTRAVVIAPDTNFTATCSGLPNGMTFDAANGWVGNTPSESGVFIVTVRVSVSNGTVLTKNYPLLVTTGPDTPPHSAVDTSVMPPGGGTATGDGVYTNGTTATVLATPNPGYAFINWTENDVVVSASASYSFTNIINPSLVANFVAVPTLCFSTHTNALVLSWPTNFDAFVLQQNSDLATTNWLNAAGSMSVVGTNKQAVIFPLAGRCFFRLTMP